MKISLNADIAGNDFEKLFGLCEGLGIRDVILFLDQNIYDSENDILSDKLLGEKIDLLKRGGLNVPVVQFPLLPSNIFIGEAPDKMTKFCDNLSIAADAGIRTAVIFPWPEASANHEENEKQWDRFINAYSRVVKTAEDKGLRLATHGHRLRKFLLHDCNSYERLFKELPSAANGFTFCMGCLHYTADNFKKCIKELADRIFLVHVRDLVKKGNEEIEEVHLGEGEVNIIEAINTLKDINYKGLLFVEHIPRIPWEGNKELIAQVQAIGFIKALLKNK